MQEHEYRARDKTVKKMSRDGLKEENLHSRKSIRVSNRETDDFFCATQAEDMEDFSKRGERAEDTKSAKKKLYSEKAGRTEAAETVGQDMEKSGKKRAASRKMRIPESESARWQEEIEEADSNTGERLSDYSSRVESIRGHPSGAREYAEAAAWTSHSRKKQQVQSYVRRERAEKTAEEKQTAQKEKESSRFRKNQETAEQSMEGFREEIKGKIKREQLHKEQKKQAGRLSFGDESSGMIQGGAFDQYGVQFDVYYGDHAAASAHGHQTWEAYIADDNGSQEVEVTSTREVNRLETVLTNHNLDTVLRNRMNDEEEQRYDYYNLTYGNRDYLFDVNTLPSGGGSGGFGYEIPAEALSDEKFANMIHEAEKYLGYPYVWGGASPSTSFDCSGFVSWVINNCGNGWNVGRQTADGLRSCCAYVSPSEAKPGDLIFFQGTYNTPGASHVGIYVGDNMMIHCGNPIQYANISSAYWQEHFMAFGRIQ